METSDNVVNSNSESKPNERLAHLTASSIIGNEILNSAGEELGKITDIMIDTTSSKVEYLVIQFGGFLGISQKYFAVPMYALSPAKEHRNAFILDETKEGLKQYPGFNKNHWSNPNVKLGDTEIQ